jgi:hypothetical protein
VITELPEECSSLVHLRETDVFRVFTEALTADVQVVLADDRPLVFAHAAVESREKQNRQYPENPKP